MARFAAQRLLAEADTLPMTPELARQLGELLEQVRLREKHVHRVQAPGGVSVDIHIGDPGVLLHPEAINLGSVQEVASAAQDLLANRPSKAAGVSIWNTSSEQPRNAGILQAITEQLPQALAAAGVRPGDLVIGNTVGTGHGDYRRALAFMQRAGGGPVDVAGLQAARVGEDYGLRPALINAPDFNFNERMGWNFPGSPVINSTGWSGVVEDIPF